MKSTAIEVQKLKKVFRVFPYKFTRNNGEFVSYLDETYLQSSMKKVVETDLDNLLETSTDERLVFKIHNTENISAVILLEKHEERVYGDDFVDFRDNRHTYACLEIVDKSASDGVPHLISKYVIPSNKINTESLLQVLDLQLDSCRLIDGNAFKIIH